MEQLEQKFDAKLKKVVNEQEEYIIELEDKIDKIEKKLKKQE